MNRENIQKVRDVIATLARGRFNMADWSSAEAPAELKHDCSTAACIGGWTNAILGEPGEFWNDVKARELLGLTKEAGTALFMPDEYWVEGRFTQKHAVRVLDHLLETGDVDWKSTRRAKKAPKPSAQDTSHASDKVPGRTP